MSTNGMAELVFGGDSRKFRLGIDELLALQEKRASGPLEILTRLRLGTWRVEDVVETLRISLIGGGMDGKPAKDLVERHVRSGNLTANVLIAMAVLLSALQGDPDDPLPGKDAATMEAPEAPASPPSPSTEPAQ